MYLFKANHKYSQNFICNSAVVVFLICPLVRNDVILVVVVHFQNKKGYLKTKNSACFLVQKQKHKILGV